VKYSLRRRERAVIVAVAAARVVQVPGDEVVDVIAVRHRFVAAARTVGVSRVVRAACMGGSARRRIRSVDGDRALVDVTIMAAVQVAVVEVVLMVAVRDRRVAAAGAVLMRMVVVGLVAHDQVLLLACCFVAWGLIRGSVLVVLVCVLFDGVVERASDDLGHVRVGERVEHVLAAAPSLDQVLRSQKPKLLRDGRQTDPRRLGELGDAPLALRETLEKAQSCLIARHAEDGCRPLERTIRNPFAGLASRVFVRLAEIWVGASNHQFTK
jgi:hypothetical protein